MSSSHDSRCLSRTGPLSGASVVVTRPPTMADGLVRRAQRQGAQVVRLPGLTLRANADGGATRRALQAALTADAWIFISPTAVDCTFVLLPDLVLPPALKVWTVGAGTARVLRRHGIQALVPATTQDSDGLLLEPSLDEVQGSRVIIVDAPGGRAILAPSLRERGAEVERIHVYERLAPRLTRRHFDALAAAAHPCISLVSSAEALGHLLAALPADLCGLWRTQPLVVSSPRLADLAAEHDFEDIHRADSALSGDLLRGAQAVLARHRL